MNFTETGRYLSAMLEKMHLLLLVVFSCIHKISVQFYNSELALYYQTETCHVFSQEVSVPKIAVDCVSLLGKYQYVPAMFLYASLDPLLATVRELGQLGLWFCLVQLLLQLQMSVEDLSSSYARHTKQIKAIQLLYNNNS